MSKLKISNASLEFCCGVSGQLPRSDKSEIVFSGKSNVGKSSLINKLLNRKSLARVSASPGKTGTINFYKVDKVRFVDLPGYGYAKVSLSEKKRWAKLVEGYFAQDRMIKLLIQLIDIRHDPSKDDLHMLEYLSRMELPFVVALTKCDKLNKMMYLKQMERMQQILKNFGVKEVIPTSTLKRQGIDELMEQIECTL